jgi:hypothetical protein
MPFKFAIGQLVTWKYAPATAVTVSSRSLFDNGTTVVLKYVIFLDTVRPTEVFEDELMGA